MALNGRLIKIFFGISTITAVGLEKSNDISVSCDMIETANSTSTWKSFIAGRKEWSITVNYLVGSVSDMVSLLTVGTSVTVQIKYGSNSNPMMYGSAIISQCRITSTTDTLIQGVFTFKGSGTLSLYQGS